MKLATDPVGSLLEKRLSKPAFRVEASKLSLGDLRALRDMLGAAIDECRMRLVRCAELHQQRGVTTDRDYLHRVRRCQQIRISHHNIVVKIIHRRTH